MKNLLKRIFNKPKRFTQEELLKKFELVVDGFKGGEANLLTKETLLLSYQGNSKRRVLTTEYGDKELNKVNWKAAVRSQEMDALNVENKNLFVALEQYLTSSLEDYGLKVKKIRNEIKENFYNIEIDFKQQFRNDDFFNDLKNLSQKVAELDGQLKLYKSKDVEAGLWKLILSIDKTIQPASPEKNITTGDRV